MVKKDNRAHNWTFVFYPDDSAPDNWRELLEDLHVPGFISPLHTDVNPDETEKKPHRHVILKFGSCKKSFEQIKSITDMLNAPIPQPVKHLEGAARYLCHLDNPEKKRYEPKDVISLAGADYFELIQNAADLDAIISEMEQWCDDNGVFSYAELCRHARKERPDWTRVLRHKCTVHMKAYLQSCQWELKNGISIN